MQIKSSCAPGLTLMERLKAPRKWAIVSFLDRIVPAVDLCLIIFNLQLNWLIHFMILTGNGMMDFPEFVKLMLTKNQFGMEISEAKGAFRIFDVDDRGYVLTSELRQAFSRLEENISEGELDDILEDKCQAGNRKISFEGICN